MRRAVIVSALVILSAALLGAQDRHPYTFDDHIAMKRIAAPVVSPDGKWVAFGATSYDKAANRGSSDIYLVPAEGGEPLQLTTNPAGDFSPAWSPDGKTLAFVSTRGGSAQVWLISIEGGEARQLTDVPTGADGPKWSPDGKLILFSSSVIPGKCPKGTVAALEEKQKSGVSAMVADDLLYRHWNAWRTDGARSHLFVADVTTGEFRDLMKDADYDCPVPPFGGGEDYNFSPDGKEVAFSAKLDPNPAWHTNVDILVVPVSGDKAPENVTAEMKGEDRSPAYSPDGRYIAFGSRRRAGFEADRLEITLRDRRTGENKSITSNFDRHCAGWLWAPDSSGLYFTAQDHGNAPVFFVPISGGVRKVVSGDTMGGLDLSADGKTLFFTRQSLSSPAEIFRAGTEGPGDSQLTFLNKPVLDRVQMGEVSGEWFEGDRGEQVQMFIIHPPGFDPSKKWPLVLLIHGGPQGAFANDFHYRWSAQLFAAPGYVVSCINFHGSDGYGQDFMDAVSRNWGGSPYRDILLGLDHLLKREYIDPARVGAAGGSYGGYMVNWISTQTDRFAALISHAGVWDLESMSATEELWFPEWEYGGEYWENREDYEKWSPHRFAANLGKFKTPTLVIHGQYDFRVPVTQAFEYFTALRRQGVPARLIYYPDETHFVSRPKNAEYWYQQVHAWFDKYLGAGGE